MTSTPVSLDESLNGSWIDINSASQIHSPMDDDSDFTKLQHPSYSIANSVISYQVERFLQEVQRNQNTNSTNGQLNNHNNNINNSPLADDLSGIYLSDSDTPVEGLESLITNLRKHQNNSNTETGSNNNKNNDLLYKNYYHHLSNGQTVSKSGECLADQLSDSLSMLSRASGTRHNSGANNDTKGGPQGFDQDFEWLWDWTAQPEYFTGQEWKVYAPKQDYLVQQRHSYYDNLNKNHDRHLFSGQVMSLLFLTNILSIIIGAGLTYGVMMRKSAA